MAEDIVKGTAKCKQMHVRIALWLIMPVKAKLSRENGAWEFMYTASGVKAVHTMGGPRPEKIDAPGIYQISNDNKLFISKLFILGNYIIYN